MTRIQGWVTLSVFKYICVNLCKKTALQITDDLKVSGFFCSDARVTIIPQCKRSDMDMMTTS